MSLAWFFARDVLFWLAKVGMSPELINGQLSDDGLSN